MCIIEGGETQNETRSELFFGSIKSFNTRRGFGFVSCEDTAKIYGRDVYISKDEVMNLADAPAVGLTVPDTEKTPGSETSKVAPVQDGMFVSFQVKLSNEGFPQAVQVRKIRRLKGVVLRPPCLTADGIIQVTGDEGVKAETDGALEQLLGADVRLPLFACGQLQLAPDDEIAFCCVNMLETDGQVMEANRIDLIRTSRVAGSLLGCFSLTLPRSSNKSATDTVTSSEDSVVVELHGHALTDRIILSEMPSDFAASDLMNFFSKIGGQVSVTCAIDKETPGFICITFNTTEQVAKFLSQSTHTISENGTTQLARLGPSFHRQCGSFCGDYACQSQTSASLSDGPIGSVHQAPLAESQEVQQFSHITSAPCHSGPALPCLDQDAQAQHAVSLSVTVQSQSSQIIYATCPPVPASPQLNQDTQAQHAASLSAPVLNMPMMSSSSSPDWRCIHGSIVVAAAAPEIMMAVGEHGYSMYLQWPTVVHATAYVVELLDQSTGVSQRFVRVANADALPVLTDLRIDGIQPGCYAAHVRCVAPCGCESAWSPWSILPLESVSSCGMSPPVASALNVLPPSAPALVPTLLPDLCPPPPSAPPSLPLTSVVPSAVLPSIPEDLNPEEVLTLD